MLRSHRNRPIIRQAVRPVIEGLESRQMLSASLTHSGLLVVQGTGHADTIAVTMDSTDPTMIDVSVNGKIKSFSDVSVRKISVNGAGGNDMISVDPTVTTPTSVSGGAGSDTLMAGGGSDSLNGSIGNDSLEGGAGNCTLLGGPGNDTLVGGTGSDSMSGGTGNDSLQGGTGADNLVGGLGNDTLMNGTGSDTIDGGKGSDHLAINPNSGVALSTLPTAVQTGLTTLAQGATIGLVVNYQEAGQTYYGTEVTINSVDTRIVVDSTGNPVTQAPGDGAGPAQGAPGDHQRGGLGSIVKVDTTANTLTVAIGNAFGPAHQVVFTVTSATTLTADGTAVTLSSLTAGEFVNVQTSGGTSSTATSITVLDRHVHGTVTAVDSAANTITLTDSSGTATTYTLNAKATVEVDGATSTLASVAVNSEAGLTISALDGTALDVHDESHNDNGGGPTNPGEPQVAFGSIVSVSTTANTITLSVDGGTDTTYNVTSTTSIFLNGAPSTLAALTVGAEAQLKLAADGITVVALQSETQNNPGAPGGPGQNITFGAIASVDTTANTITLAGRDGAASATYSVTTTTTITLDGVATPLSGLVAGDKTILTLASDGTTVVSVKAQTPESEPTQPTDPAEPVVGAISAIDTTANTITLTRHDGTSGPYTVTSTTTIMLDGAASMLSSLVVGDKALVVLAADGKTAVSIAAQTPPAIPTNPTGPTQPGENKIAEGPVSAVSTTANTITLSPDGVSTTYTVTSTTTISLNGVNSALSAIAAGDKARLDIAADGVTVLSIEAQTPPPPNPGGSGQNKNVQGPVASVSTSANTITLNPDGVSTTYTVTSATTITLDGATSTLSAIVAGDKASLSLAADGVTVVRIEAHSVPVTPPVPPRNQTAQGPVASVSTSANTITLSPDGVSTTYTVTSATTITLDGATSTLSAIIAGDRASLVLAADGVSAVSIEAHTLPVTPPPGPTQNETAQGPVASVSTSANTITLNPDGVSTTYTVTSATTITLDGATSTLSAIVAGDRASLVLAADGVTAVSIEAHSVSVMPPPVPPQNQTAQGPVASVSTSANTITLNPDGVSTTYTVTSATTITLDGATSTLSAIVAGDRATVALAADGITAVKIEAHSMTSAG